jgi:protein arginine N-methyltransferase 3
MTPSGTVVAGTFHCRKKETNSRELQIEIHYAVRQPDEASVGSTVTVQMYQVQ